MRLLVLILFLLGLLATGVLGTETSLLFFWPGCLLIGLAGLLVGLRWQMRISFAPNDLCLLSVLLLTLYLLGRAWLSPVALYAREDIFIILGCFVTYVLTATVASHPRWRLGIMGVLVLLTLGNLVVGFIHFSGNPGFHVVPHFVRTFGAGRIGGFFNNANHLAAFLSLVMFLSAGLTFFGRGSASVKLLLGFLGLASAIGMALTQSRGAMVGMVGGVAMLGTVSLWVMWKTQRHIFGRLLIGIAILAALGGAVIYIVNQESVKRRMVSNPVNKDVRLHIWEAALQQHAMQPVTGMGSRAFYDYCITLRPKGMPVYHNDPLFAHNEYIQVLADYGWIGLVLAVAAILLHLSHGLRFVKWFGEERFLNTGVLSSNTLGFAVGALSALAATLLHAAFEFHFHVAATAITAAFAAGLLANPGFDAGEGGGGRMPKVRLFSKLVLIGASVWMIGGAVKLGPADYDAAQAQISASQDDMQGRMEWLDKAVKRDPLNPEHWYQRGLAFMDQWKPTLPKSVGNRVLEKAAKDLQQAVKLNSQHYLYSLALTDAYDALQRQQEALASAQLAVKAAPWHEESRLGLAIHYHRWGQFAEAEKAYLWAWHGRLRNPEGAMGWGEGYQRLLRDAADATK
ncbi:MAG: O-antigen ligase [Verrucomicrobiaceae bacterium]|nr:O-antigen ligase [Verrucomicrobiaceae bacterium]